MSASSSRSSSSRGGEHTSVAMRLRLSFCLPWKLCTGVPVPPICKHFSMQGWPLTSVHFLYCLGFLGSLPSFCLLGTSPPGPLLPTRRRDFEKHCEKKWSPSILWQQGGSQVTNCQSAMSVRLLLRHRKGVRIETSFSLRISLCCMICPPPSMMFVAPSLGSAGSEGLFPLMSWFHWSATNRSAFAVEANPNWRCTD